MDLSRVGSLAAPHDPFALRSRWTRGPATRPSVPLVVCVAVGPGEILGVLEIIEAARIYFLGPYKVIVIDDTGALDLLHHVRGYPEVECLRNAPTNGFAKLLLSLQRAYCHALDRFDFDALLKLDTDSLIIGPGLDRDILNHFAHFPNAGMVGATRWRERNDAQWARRMQKNIHFWGALIERARGFGYSPGESVLGGAYALSRRCLEELRSNGFLELRPPAEPRIAEDVTYSLLTRASGMELHELGGGVEPLALAWRGLPAPPRELVRLGKKATHSVKFSAADLKVRDYFARVRSDSDVSPKQARERSTAQRISRSLRRRMRWPGLAARAMGHRHLRAARRMYAWLAWDRPLQASTWVRLGLSCLPRPVFDVAMRARRIAIRRARDLGLLHGHARADQ
jgi:hypothetical protein